MKQKIAALFCAVTLAAGMTPAFAESGPLRTVFDAAETLFFNTSNVTLTADVSVAANGTVFKTLNGTYIQQDGDNAITLDWTTRRPDGSGYDSAWHVTALDGTVWSVDSLGLPYYSVHSCLPRARILSDPGSTLRPMLELVSPALAMADLLYPSCAQRTPGQEGETLRIRFEDGEAPALIDAAAEKLVRYAAERYMGIYMGAKSEPDPEEDSRPRLVCGDWDLLFANAWERLYGESYDPASVGLSEDSEQRTEAVWTRLNETAEAACEGREGGCVLFRPADGTCAWYERYEDCVLAGGLQEVYYDDIDSVFLLWLRERTGDSWDPDTLWAARLSDNTGLTDALNALEEEMRGEYLEKLDGAPFGRVDAKGTLTPIFDLEAYNQSTQGQNSVAYTLLFGMQSLRVGKADVEFSLDPLGRLTGAKGEVGLVFRNSQGHEDTVTLTLDCTAGAYGESEVAPFDPEKWGVVSFTEWLESQNALSPSPEATPVPESVTLNGQEYPLHP